MPTHSVQLLDWGLIAYQDALARQRKLHQALIRGEAGDTLIVCQHPPVLTKGRRTTEASLLSSETTLRDEQIEIIEIERGGDITFHGPGQLVAYPILNLRNFKTDVGWYMRQLEEVVIHSLRTYQIEGQRVAGKTGVWVCEQEKIASQGVRISRWCTLHGIAINVTTESERGFSHILPCGLIGVRATSIERFSPQKPSMTGYQSDFCNAFCQVFNSTLTAN